MPLPPGRPRPLAWPGLRCLPGACPAPRCCARPRGIFGQRLEDTVLYEKKFGQHPVPLLVEQCVDFIRKRGLTEEGLFRMPGQANLVKDLQDSFDCGKKLQFDRNTDVHTVASLLKLYLRELPEPVIPFANYEDFISCGHLLSKDKGENSVGHLTFNPSEDHRIMAVCVFPMEVVIEHPEFVKMPHTLCQGTRELTEQVSCLPQANYNLLKFICKFLDEVQSYANHNKMSVQNLATVFGPNILRPQIEDPMTQMEGTSLVQCLMSILISEHGKIFGSTLIQDSVQPAADLQCPLSCTYWNSQGGRTESISSHVGSLSATRPSAAKPSMQQCNKKGKGHQPASSPNHRRQGLSTWKCSLLQQGAGSFYHPLGSSFLESSCLSLHANWLVDGPLSVQGHHGSSFGGQVKDSDSCQRLSTYDNVPILHLFDGACSNASPSFSTSSSGLSVAVDSVTACATCKTGACLALNPLLKESSPGGPLPHSGVCLESSSWEESDARCSRSRNERNLAVASKDTHHCSEALQGLVAELKAELRKQRSEYETTFKRMEETSTELRKLVTRLEEELIKEKKKNTVLEIKLRNTERARKDAEKRNHLLQEEMEYFFTILGNITVESQLANV